MSQATRLFTANGMFGYIIVHQWQSETLFPVPVFSYVESAPVLVQLMWWSAVLVQVMWWSDVLVQLMWWSDVLVQLMWWSAVLVQLMWWSAVLVQLMWWSAVLEQVMWWSAVLVQVMWWRLHLAKHGWTKMVVLEPSSRQLPTVKPPHLQNNAQFHLYPKLFFGVQGWQGTQSCGNNIISLPCSVYAHPL
jgi:hypothetical protein